MSFSRITRLLQLVFALSHGCLESYGFIPAKVGLPSSCHPCCDDMLPQKREVADSQESAVADRLGLENRQCGSSQAEWEAEQPSHKQQQPQQTLGTQENKGQASHSHHVWRPPSTANVGSTATGMSSAGKTQHENHDHCRRLGLAEG